MLLSLGYRLQHNLRLPLKTAASSVGDTHDCHLLLWRFEERSASRGFVGFVEKESSDDGFVGAEVSAVGLLDCHFLAAVDP